MAVSASSKIREAGLSSPIFGQRQVFEAFSLEVRYDKVERRIEISATVLEAVAKAFENAKEPPGGGLKRHYKGHSWGRICPSNGSDSQACPAYRPCEIEPQSVRLGERP